MSDAGAVKHTPGPWVLSASGLIVMCPARETQGHYWEIADLSGYEEKDKAETEADARLIAAAPELLAAATLMYEAREIAPYDVKRIYTAHLSLKNAIAKATGPQFPSQHTDHGGRPETGDQQDSPRVAKP